MRSTAPPPPAAATAMVPFALARCGAARRATRPSSRPPPRRPRPRLVVSATWHVLAGRRDAPQPRRLQRGRSTMRELKTYDSSCSSSGRPAARARPSTAAAPRTSSAVTRTCCKIRRILVIDVDEHAPFSPRNNEVCPARWFALVSAAAAFSPRAVPKAPLRSVATVRLVRRRARAGEFVNVGDDDGCKKTSPLQRLQGLLQGRQVHRRQFLLRHAVLLRRRGDLRSWLRRLRK